MSNESMSNYIEDTPSEIAELLAENKKLRMQLEKAENVLNMDIGYNVFLFHEAREKYFQGKDIDQTKSEAEIFSRQSNAIERIDELKTRISDLDEVIDKYKTEVKEKDKIIKRFTECMREDTIYIGEYSSICDEVKAFNILDSKK